MLQKNLSEQKFRELAKDLEMGQAFIDACLDADNWSIQVGLYNGKSVEPCDFCKKNLEPGDTTIFIDYTFSHLRCCQIGGCTYCKKLLSVKSEDLVFYKGLFLCQKDFDSLVACTNCGNRVKENTLLDGFCPSCTATCHRCANRFPVPRMYTLRGAKVCKPCGGREIWVKGHEFNPLTILRFRGSPKDGIFYGVELELEAESLPACIELAEKIVTNFGNELVVKHDGSLKDKGLSGLEIVTAPGDMDFQKNLWTDFFSKDYKFESFSSERCSTHVHMSKQPIKPLHQARMAHFVYASENRALIETIGGRQLNNPWGNRYASLNLGLTVKDLVEVSGTPSYWRRHVGMFEQHMLLPPKSRAITFKGNPKSVRYAALNLTNPNTIEVRIFCGTSQLDSMLKNLQFCQAMLHYCSPYQSSNSDLTNPDNFKKFVKDFRSIYPHLYKYLVSKGEITVSAHSIRNKKVKLAA